MKNIISKFVSNFLFNRGFALVPVGEIKLRYREKSNFKNLSEAYELQIQKKGVLLGNYLKIHSGGNCYPGSLGRLLLRPTLSLRLWQKHSNSRAMCVNLVWPKVS
jgi:hypothetical protein